MTSRITMATLAVLLVSAGPSANPEREVGNLAALARLYGYVRYFHPSPSAISADWDSVLVGAVAPVRAARSAGELKAVLESVFRPLAPGLLLSLSPIVPAAPSPGEAGGPRLAWRHEGFGVRGANTEAYSSTTVTLEEPVADSFPAPGERITDQLSRGLWFTLPLSVTPGGIADSIPGRNQAPRPSPADLNVRIADAISVWAVFQHFHPYLEAVDRDWTGALPATLRAMLATTDPREEIRVLHDLVQRAEDGHATVGPPRILRPGVPRGYLPFAVDERGGRVFVTRSLDSLVKPGDEVVRIAGERARPRLERLAGEEFGTARFRRAMALGFAFIRGDSGASHRVELRRGGRLLVRDVPVSFTANRAPPALSPTQLPSIGEIRPGVQYVDLTRAGAEELMSAADSLARAQAVIFDLRGYPNNNAIVLGFLSDSAVAGPLTRTAIVTRPDRDSRNRWSEDQARLPSMMPRIRGTIVFLSFPGAVSAAESFLAAVRDNRLGVIVGDTTAGANGGINWFYTPSGFYVSFSGQQALTPAGRELQGTGVAPDVIVRPTVRHLVEGRDAVLERALELVAAP